MSIAERRQTHPQVFLRFSMRSRVYIRKAQSRVTRPALCYHFERVLYLSSSLLAYAYEMMVESHARAVNIRQRIA